MCSYQTTRNLLNHRDSAGANSFAKAVFQAMKMWRTSPSSSRMNSLPQICSLEVNFGEAFGRVPGFDVREVLVELDKLFKFLRNEANGGKVHDSTCLR
jgi:hypothetical protein